MVSSKVRKVISTASIACAVTLANCLAATMVVHASDGYSGSDSGQSSYDSGHSSYDSGQSSYDSGHSNNGLGESNNGLDHENLDLRQGDPNSINSSSNINGVTTYSSGFSRTDGNPAVEPTGELVTVNDHGKLTTYQSYEPTSGVDQQKLDSNHPSNHVVNLYNNEYNSYDGVHTTQTSQEYLASHPGSFIDANSRYGQLIYDHGVYIISDPTMRDHPNIVGEDPNKDVYVSETNKNNPNAQQSDQSIMTTSYTDQTPSEYFAAHPGSHIIQGDSSVPDTTVVIQDNNKIVYAGTTPGTQVGQQFGFTPQEQQGQQQQNQYPMTYDGVASSYMQSHPNAQVVSGNLNTPNSTVVIYDHGQTIYAGTTPGTEVNTTPPANQASTTPGASNL